MREMRGIDKKIHGAPVEATDFLMIIKDSQMEDLVPMICHTTMIEIVVPIVFMTMGVTAGMVAGDIAKNLMVEDRTIPVTIMATNHRRTTALLLKIGTFPHRHSTSSVLLVMIGKIGDHHRAGMKIQMQNTVTAVGTKIVVTTFAMRAIGTLGMENLVKTFILQGTMIESALMTEEANDTMIEGALGIT